MSEGNDTNRSASETSCSWGKLCNHKHPVSQLIMRFRRIDFIWLQQYFGRNSLDRNFNMSHKPGVLFDWFPCPSWPLHFMPVELRSEGTQPCGCSYEISQATHAKGANCLVNTKHARYNKNSKFHGFDHSPKGTVFSVCEEVMITVEEFKSTNIRDFEKENSFAAKSCINVHLRARCAKSSYILRWAQPRFPVA